MGTAREATEMATVDQKVQEVNLEALMGTLKPGDTLYFILRHKSESGMSRWVDVYKLDGQPYPVHLGFQIAWALGYLWDWERNGFKVSGNDFDVANEVIGSLGWKLFGDRYSLRKWWL